ncbi:MAG: serine--tRNA ligase [Bowdeniella nasicola]|nr:serine--tRNA ligase [Bowdeniella nasicola]
MIDLRALRANPDVARASQRARGADEGLIDQILAADETRRTALQRHEDTRADHKAASRKIGQAGPDGRAEAIERARSLADEVKRLAAEAEEAEAELMRLAYQLDNIIEDAPAGGEEDFVVLRTAGPERRDFAAEGFTPKDHLDLGEGIGAIDVKRGVKVAGSRFYYMTGVGARLELALLNCAMDLAIQAGFTPMMTPTLVSPEVMDGTGFLGEHADEVYRLATDDLYLTGTSEVALAGYHADEILDLGGSPRRYAGWSTCYRREAGSYGKDTRGIIRVHQFNKVEMFSYCSIEEAHEEHLRLLGFEEDMLAKVELPYRVIDVAAGDLGSSAARKFDCEAWLPTQERYMEVTSTSNCTTFQARRLKVRERHDGQIRPVATLNGTFATTRWIVAILENHQREDGSVVVPEGLRPYMGGLEVMEPLR